METTGKLIMLLGGAILLIGALIFLLGRLGIQYWNLPGNISLKTGNGTCIIALGSSILISILLTVILNVLVRWFNR